MTFISPDMLALLLLVPLGIIVYKRVDAQRKTRAVSLAAMGFAPASSSRQPRAPHLPAAIFLTALALMAVASARPQLKVGLPHREGVVILAFDASNSMLATDLEPTRMDAAKAAAKEFIDAQPSTIKIGVVAFNNGALVTQQPTSDRSDATAAIERLTSAGATSLGQGIFASLSAIAGKPLTLPEDASADDIAEVDIGYYGSAAIVLLSDGENTSGPDAEAVAQLASTAGVHIFPIGIGSSEGTVVQIDGFSVATALDERSLQQIASVTNGAYFSAADSETLTQIYRSIDLRTVTDPKLTEVTAVLAGLSSLLLLIGGIMSMLWFGRLV